MSKCPRGFSLIELLIVVAVILIIAAIAIPSFMRSRIAANQSSAVESLRTMNTAEATYSVTYGTGYSPNLTVLGPPTVGAGPTSTAAGLLDSVLAQGLKSGYSFVYSSAAPDTSGRITSYSFNANPESSFMGTMYYLTDQSGVIRVNPTTNAASTDSPLAG